MADDCGLPIQAADHLIHMIGNLSHRLVREDFGVVIGLFDCGGVIRPAWSQRNISRLLEHGSPPVPTTRQQPKAMDEDDRLEARRIRTLHLARLVVRNR